MSSPSFISSPAPPCKAKVLRKTWKAFARLYEPNAVAPEKINVVRGPEIWFRVMWHQWNSDARRAELNAYQQEHGAARDLPPGMQANYWRPGDEESQENPTKQKPGGTKGPKLDPAPGAPEPDIADAAFRAWDGSLPSRLFVYYDARGVPHSVVARYERAAGKKVRTFYWAEHERVAPHWLDKRPPHPIIYRLPQVWEGVRDGKTIVFLSNFGSLSAQCRRPSRRASAASAMI